MIKHPKYEECNGYIYDYNTSNASFIAMACLLRKKGIKNYRFFLKLYDEDLVGVDPLDDNLPPHLKLKVQIEIRRNFWYFIREVFRVISPAGPTAYQLHRGNLALSWCITNNLCAYEVLPRQQGKTWAVIAHALWVFSYAGEQSKLIFANKAAKDSTDNLTRLRKSRDALPPYLRNDKSVNAKGEVHQIRDGSTAIRNAFGNEIQTVTSAHTEQDADGKGRGMSTPWVWLDEFAFIKHNDTIYSAMMPAWSKSAEIARGANRPTGLILTTTPGDLNVAMGAFAYEVRDNAAKFTENCYDFTAMELDAWITKNTNSPFVYIEYNYKQLGCDDKWFEEQCRILLNNWPKIRREVLIQWSRAGSNSPFDPEDIQDLRAMMITESDALNITINQYYTLNVYKQINIARKYLVTVDVAKGRGAKADRTAICVTDAETNECHAIFKSNVISYIETYRLLHTLVYKTVPNCVIIIENNLDTLIEYVRESTLKHFLYYEYPTDPTKERRVNGFVKGPLNNTVVYGINTNSKTRPLYFEILYEYVVNFKERICARELIEEIEFLEARSATRIEAVSGKHDDVIMSYLLGQYVQHYGTNKMRFGLFKQQIDEEQEKVNNPLKRHIVERDLNDDSSEFFKELFTEFDTDETLEKRENAAIIAAQRGNNVDDELIGAKDITGVTKLAPGFFTTVNDINYQPNQDAFSRVTQGYNGNSDYSSDDDDNGWF